MRLTRVGPRSCVAYGVLPQALAFQEKEEQGNHIMSLPLNTPPPSDHFNFRGFPESVVVCLFSNLQWISFQVLFQSLCGPMYYVHPQHPWQGVPQLYYVL